MYTFMKRIIYNTITTSAARIYILHYLGSFIIVMIIKVIMIIIIIIIIITTIIFECGLHQLGIIRKRGVPSTSGAPGARRR